MRCPNILCWSKSHFRLCTSMCGFITSPFILWKGLLICHSLFKEDTQILSNVYWMWVAWLSQFTHYFLSENLSKCKHLSSFPFSPYTLVTHSTITDRKLTFSIFSRQQMQPNIYKHCFSFLWVPLHNHYPNT